jgi:DNA-binding transcriptional ArsR family regulator
VSTPQAGSDVFAAVASPVRRSLLALLHQGERPATELANSFDLTQSAVSQQLKLLRQAGLVAERRVGRQRLYHLNAGPLREIADWVREYEHFWSGRLDRLGEVMDRSGLARAKPRRPRRASRR